MVSKAHSVRSGNMCHWYERLHARGVPSVITLDGQSHAFGWLTVHAVARHGLAV